MLDRVGTQVQNLSVSVAENNDFQEEEHIMVVQSKS